MSALIADVVDGRLTHNVANSAVNAGGKILKSTELKLKYSRLRNSERELVLIEGPKGG